jgi:DnaJ-class molecular chaperone
VFKEHHKELLRRQMLMSNIKKKRSDCPRCDGKGKDPQDKVCELCEGKGQLTHLKVGDNEIIVKDGALFRG